MTAWEPDTALADIVRTRGVDIRTLTAPDRAWIVAALSADGWTGPAMAAQLRCSVRLIQQIKSDPATTVAGYALMLQERMRDQRALHDMETRALEGQIGRYRREVDRLHHHRDTLLGHVHTTRKDRA